MPGAFSRDCGVLWRLCVDSSPEMLNARQKIFLAHRGEQDRYVPGGARGRHPLIHGWV